jgi:hypothetical protein
MNNGLIKKCDKNSDSLYKNIAYFGLFLIILSVILSYQFHSKYFLGTDGCVGLCFASEIFEWRYFSTVFPFLVGILLVFSNLKSLRRSFYNLKVIIYLCKSASILFFLHFMRYFYYEMKDIDNLLTLIVRVIFLLLFVIIVVFPFIYISKSLKCRELKNNSKFEKRLNFKLISILVLFFFIISLSIYKIFDTTLNIHYITLKKCSQIKENMSKEEVHEITGNPISKVFIYKLEDFIAYITIRKGNVIRICNKRELLNNTLFANINIGIKEEKIISMIGQPSEELWVYSFTPYDKNGIVLNFINGKYKPKIAMMY